MEAIRFRDLCSELIKDLNKSQGDKNIIKLSIDIQLPKKIIETPGLLIKAISDISLYLSNLLINGVINIEITKQSELSGLVKILVQITGNGSFIQTGIGLTKKGIGDHFKNLPYSIRLKTDKRQLSIEFEAEINTIDQYTQENGIPFGGKKVLLAEDNEINAMVFTSFLEEWGFEVTIATNGAEAVTLAHESVFDVILMDIYMPILNGNLATIKIREFNPSIPIIALTASTVNKDVLDAMNAGANDHLLKPVSSNDLLKILSKYL